MSRIISPVEIPKGETVTDDYDKANVLNIHFAQQSQTTTLDDNIPQPTYSSTTSTLSEFTITTQETLQALNKLDVNKSCGPDHLPAKILKLVAIIIAEPLTKIVQ